MNTSFNKYKKTKINKKKQSAPKIKKEAPISNPLNQENGQIISGYFLNEKSYKELIITRVNNILYIFLGTLVAFCFICYYFVSCKEVQLNKISRATLELNYENDELQNKIDSLQSYYNIDKAVSKTNFLERAKQVVEVSAIGTPDINLNKANKNGHSLVISY